MDRILVIEDEESVNRGISFALEREGYKVDSCLMAAQARRCFEQNRPELIICDVNLKDGNGLDFVRFARKNSDAHIIVLTALDNETDYVLGYEAGADDYVTKPFHLSVLLLKIKAYLKRQNSRAADCISSGDILFYLKEMRAEKNGEEIPLTKNEWRILSLFLEYPKQILSKNQMLEQLFDKDKNFVDENTIAVNIRRIREKIEPDAANPTYIKNVRGLGYIWDSDCVYKSIE